MDKQQQPVPVLTYPFPNQQVHQQIYPQVLPGQFADAPYAPQQPPPSYSQHYQPQQQQQSQQQPQQVVHSN